jgi:arylsulfatase A-like enzyme
MNKLVIVVGILIAVIAVVVRLFMTNVVFNGLVRIYWNKLTEVILPPQPVEWLQNYTTNEGIWKNLAFTEDFEERPNVLFILADDLGFNDLSGGVGIGTPNIDSLARNGLNFTEAYASQATCAPSRAALYTGRYPTGIGMEFTPIPKFFAKFMADKRPPDAAQTIYHDAQYDSVPDMKDISMPREIPMIAEALKEYGYHNYFLGKWDGTFRFDENTPLHRGYDETLGFLLGATLYADVNDPRMVAAHNISVDNFMKRMLSYKIAHNDGPLFRPSEYLTDYLGTEASALIYKLGEKKKERESKGKSEQQQRDEPWFITMAFNAPHNPFQALKSDFEREDIQRIPSFIGKIYASMILSLDRNVGRIIDALKATGQYENTMIIFTSDNGGAPYVGLPNINAPYRGWKATLFEGGIRIPFLLQWPKRFSKPMVVRDAIIHIDLFPTILSVASKGVQLLKNSSSSVLPKLIMDGKNFLSNVFKYTNNQVAPVESAEEAVSPPTVIGGEERIFFWRSGSYRSIKYYHLKFQVHSYLNKIWFYDLSVDKTEKNNLIDQLAAFIVTKDGKPSELSIQSETDLIKHLLTPFAVAHDAIEITQGDAKPAMNSPEIILKYLLIVYQKLQEINSQQHEPLWPALVELPICIDKPQRSDLNCSLKDEYIVWAN